RNRADGNAGAAVDAFHRIDVKHLFAGELVVLLFGMDAVNGASVHASCVLGADAGFRNHVCHKFFGNIQRTTCPEFSRNRRFPLAVHASEKLIVIPMPAAKVRKAVFPAAGLGTRFLPATKSMPKEMLPLVDKPIIQYGVEEAVHSGIRNIIMVTGRGKSAIEDHFDHSFELEHQLESHHKKELLAIVRGISDMINVSYVRQKEALGLGH